jgi:hypothetical protein
MPLPRPARLLRQYPTLLRRQTPTRLFNTSRPAYIAGRRRKGDVEGEDDFGPDVEAGGQYFLPLPTRKTKQLEREQRASQSELEAINSRIGEEDEEQVAKGPFGLKRDEVDAYEDEMDYEPREARRSPATLIGSKRIGMATLPEELVEGVAAAIDGSSYSQASPLE